MVGLIGEKIGMTHQFNEEGNLIPITLLKVERNIVINKRSIDKDGYNAIVIGTVDLNEKKMTKPYKGQFKDGVSPKKYLKEFRINDPEKYEIGQEIGLEIFNDNDYIDVIGISKGKGYQGVVKRYGFHGGRKTHGSKFHRANGSTGQCTYPGKVFKGNKRAGRMGGERITSQNLKIFVVDNDEKLILVKGAVPGIKKGIVYINKAKKKINKK
jgi:large subunit ribosomal protein L3